jgi:hypothetical protein
VADNESESKKVDKKDNKKDIEDLTDEEDIIVAEKDKKKRQKGKIADEVSDIAPAIHNQKQNGNLISNQISNFCRFVEFF